MRACTSLTVRLSTFKRRFFSRRFPGKAEAAAYDKFACFCKVQADNKQYAIEKSTEKIEKLTARIEKLDADIQVHNENIASAKKEVETNTKESEEETAKRKETAKKFKAKDFDFATAIKACQGAVKSLKESGGSAAGFSFVQKAYKESSKADADAAEVLRELDAQEPASYNYHSSEIIAVLQGLIQTFKEKQRTAWDAEANLKQTYNLAETARQNAIKVASEMQAEEESAAAEKEDEMNTKQQVKDAESADKEADQSFLKKLTGQCEEKAKLFDQRSQSRVAEMKALVEATGMLKGDGGQKYSANKKLVGLVQQKQQRDLAADYDSYSSDSDEIDEDAASFIQKRQRASRRSPTEQKVMQLLAQKAKALRSTVLSSLAIRLSKDHFVKVRALIKDLIAKLKAQGEADADHHGEYSRRRICHE